MVTAADAILLLDDVDTVNELRSLADSLSAAAPAGDVRTAILYGGEFRNFPTSGPVGAWEVAQLLVVQRPSDFYRIDETEVGKFLNSTEFRSALERIAGNPDVARELLNGDPNTSFFGDASARYASSIDGAVLTITGDANVNRVFGVRELDAALANPHITTIDGVSREKWNTLNSTAEVFDKLTDFSKIRTADIAVGRGDEGLFGRVPASYFSAIGSDASPIDTTDGRFVDNFKNQLANDPQFVERGRALSKFLGPAAKIFSVAGAAGLILQAMSTDARASALYEAGDSRGATKVLAGGAAGLAAGLLVGESVAVAAAPLLAFGPLGWTAYAGLVGGSAIAADQLANSGVGALVDFFEVGTVNFADAAILQSINDPNPPGEVLVGRSWFVTNLDYRAVGLRVEQIGEVGEIRDALVDTSGNEVQAGIRVDVNGAPLLNAQGMIDVAYVVRTSGELVSIDYLNPDVSGGSVQSVMLLAHDAEGAQAIANSVVNAQGQIPGELIQDAFVTDAVTAREIETTYATERGEQIAEHGTAAGVKIAKSTFTSIKALVADRRPVSYGQLGAVFGSTLSRLMGPDNVWESIGTGALLSTIGANVGQELDLAEGFLFDRNGNPIRGFEDFPADLAAAGLGAVGSYLMAEWVQHWGLGEFGTGAATSATGAAIGQIADNLVHLGETINGQIVQWNTGIGSGGLYLNATANFLGSFLASELIEFDTIGGQIGASVGSAVGGLYAAGVFSSAASSAATTGFAAFVKALSLPAGPVGAFIGAFVGYILGGLIGSLLSGKPKAQAELAWSEQAQQYQTARVWAKNGGSKDGARSLAESVSGTVNGVLATIGGKVLDGESVRIGTYGQWGKKFIYWDETPTSSSQTVKFSDAGGLINHGTYIALSDIASRLAGGNIYIKRALAATIAQSGGNATNAEISGAAGLFSTETLLGNVIIAQDYTQYVANADAIVGLLAAQPNSSFTAGWMVTLQRAKELGLDKRAVSDWVGGWSTFLDEAAEARIDGEAITPSSIFLGFDRSDRTRLFSFADASGSFIGLFEDTIDTFHTDDIHGTSGADGIILTGDSLTNATGLQILRAGQDVGAHASWSVEIAAHIYAGAGNDIVKGGDLGNDLFGEDGNDLLVGGKLDDWIFGGAGDDRLFAGRFSDTGVELEFSFADNSTGAIDSAGRANGGNGNYLSGEAGDDRLYGGKGSDWLAGGAGTDRLYGGDGGDILDGGAGIGDLQYGGAGSDQYIFNKGDGADSVFDSSDPAGEALSSGDSIAARMAGITAGTIKRNWAGDGQYTEDGSVKGGEDAIVFGAGISIQNLLLSRSGSSATPGQDLILQIADLETLTPTGDSITVQNWFESTNRVEWLRFADGEEIRIGDVASFIKGTSGDDVIIGTNANDFAYAGAGNDVMHLLAGNDFGFGGADDDFVAGDGDDDWVSGGSGNDSVLGGQGDDLVFGDGGNDDLYAGTGNDILSGGTGDDAVVGGAGNDVFKYSRNDGRDTLLDALVDNWEIVSIGSTYLNGYQFNQDATITKGSEVVFDGQTYHGRFDWDAATLTLRRFMGPINGTIAANSGTDTLEFGAGIDIQDLMLRQYGLDLQIAITTGDGDARTFDQITDHITITNWFGAASASIEQFAFVATGVHNVAAWSLADVGTDAADTLAGGAGIDWITGNGGDDDISGGGGADILSGGQGGDLLKGGADADILYGGASNDILDGGTGADQLFGGAGTDIASYASSAAGVKVYLDQAFANTGDGFGDVYDGIEGLEGSAYADVLAGGAGGDELRGGAGNDSLYGGAGDDVYEFNAGDGADVIQDAGLSVEEILRADGTLNMDLFTPTWTDLGLINNGLGLWHGYALSVSRNGSNEVVYQSRSGVDFLYPFYTSTYPTLIVAPTLTEAPAGGAWPFSNGQWKGGAARSGNGVQTLRTLNGASGGDDVLSLGDGVSLSDLSLTRSGAGNKDLVVNINGGGSVTILDQSSESAAIETLQLADGLSGNLKSLKLGAEAGTASDDLYIGSAGADSFSGGLGDDVIAGGAGADALDGGVGDDVLEGGAGADILNGGGDSLTSGGAPSSDISKNYGDTIRYNASAAGVTIDLAAKTASGGDAAGDVIAADGLGVSTIENVIGSNAGSDFLRGDARANRLAGLGGNDILYGEAGDDVLSGGAGADQLLGGDGIDNLTGDDGADSLDGGAGADLLFGGAGIDTLIGGDGADILNGGSEADTLYGGDGDDALSGDDGADYLSGGAGKDQLTGGKGADVLEGGAGSDSYSFDANSGADIVLDSANGGVDKNVIAIGVSKEKIWITQSGNDLVIRVLGGDTVVSVHDYFVGTDPRAIRQINASDGAIFLKYAEPLILQMSGITPVPAAMPSIIAAMLPNYWHADGTAAPLVDAVRNLSMAEDGQLTGNVGAIDHDENIASYARVSGKGPAHGSVSLNASTGAWTYTPNADSNGADVFVVQVQDDDNHIVEQTINVAIAPVNDAPRNIESAAALNIAENSIGGTDIGAFSATDIDDAASELSFSLVNDAGGRFTISPTGQLRVLADDGLDYEADATHAHTIRVRVTDSGGLSFEKDFSIDVTNVNEAPGAPSIALRNDGVFSESAPGAAALGGAIIADLSALDPEGDAISYAVVSDAQNWLTISGGQVQFKAGLNVSFEDLANAGWTLTDVDADGLREASYAFSVRAGDGVLNSVSATSVLRIEDVNEAPIGLDLTGAVAGVDERDRPDPLAPTPAAIKLGTLIASDPDLASSGDLAQLVFSLADPNENRFEILNGSELWLKTGAMASIDFEAAQTLDVEIVVRDRAGAVTGLSQTRTFTFAVQDLVDVLVGGDGDDALTGQQGQDLLKGEGGADALDGGAGNDSLYGGLGADILTGGAGDDALDGEDGADHLSAGDGVDVLSGGAGADILNGGAGNDTLDGGAGDDVLIGGAGADSIQGGAGVDTLAYSSSAGGISVNLATGLGLGGDAQGDTIAGIENVIGSQFADTLSGTSAAETLDGGAGDDAIIGGGGADLLIGGDGADVITGGADADVLQGGAGADTLIGGAGDDVLDGGDGNDTLYAESGNDMLTGGLGADFMQGGEGDDTYVVDLFSGADVIDNFDYQGVDVLSIRGAGGAQIDASYIWLERADVNGTPNASGNSLLLSFIGTSTSVLLQDWYVDTSTGSAKLDYTFSGAQYAEQVALEQLVTLMANRTKPSTQAGFDALHADASFDNPWKNYWGINHAPALTTVAQVESSEDVSATFEVQVSDDFLALGMQIVVEPQGASGAALVQGYTVQASPSGGGRYIVTIAPNANVSGQTTLHVYAVDSGGLASTPQVVTLNVAAIADAPGLSVGAASIAGSLDGGTAGLVVSQNLSLPISAALNDLDGSETLSITVTGLPPALALSKGVLQGDGSWSLTPSDLIGLAITGPASSAQNFTLTIVATATESANGSIANSVTKTIAVSLNARPTDIVAGAALTIAENSANSVSIASMLSSDPNGAGDTQTYALVNNAGGRFAIDATSGALSVADGALLDFEANATHTIRVRATDSAGLYFEKDFSVQVTDVNEAPVLTALTASFDEAAAIGASIGTLSVLDSDTNPAYRNFRYELVGGETSFFSINSTTGEIGLAAALNYEVAGGAQRSAQVRVWDGGAIGAGLSSLATVLLNVNDVNEAVTLTNGFNTVAEGLAINSTLGTLSVSDLDTLNPAFRNYRYEIIGGDSAFFNIDPLSGVLSLKSGLDFDAVTGGAAVRTAQVRVWDQGAIGVGNSSTAAFTLNVTNVNDIAPTLTLPSAPSVFETVGVGTTAAVIGAPITTTSGAAVHVTAADGETGSSMRYAKVSGGTGDAYFNVDAITGNVTWAANVNFESLSNPALTLKVQAWDGGAIGQGLSSAVQTLTINIQDVNERPTMNAMTQSVAENTPVMSGGAYTSSWILPATDPDKAGTSNATLTYSLVSGDTSAFGLQGNKLVFGVAANYEAKSQYNVVVRASDGGNLSSQATFTVNIAPVNEGAEMQSAGISNVPWWIGGYTLGGFNAALSVVTTDPEGHNLSSAVIQKYLAGNNTWSAVTPINMNVSGHNASVTVSGYIIGFEVKFTDTAGAQSTWQISGATTFNRVAPIVFDLDGNGLDLVSYDVSTTYFDIDADGVRQRSGWVGANDGILVIDRNQNGLIDDGAEIAFSQDVGQAVSDLEGLRAYDTNDDGFFSAADDQYSTFKIWKDVNQDGFSQSDELTSLADNDIAAINLTLNVTGASTQNASDNVLYGTTQFIRGDGTTGTIGDVMLAYEKGVDVNVTKVETVELLAPIVLDLNGDGAALTSRTNSSVRFDANNDGVGDRIGWVSAFDGILALDRDGDGLITRGAEISFIQDSPGAVSDLEGLRAFDTNANGFFDGGDARFADFRVWRDSSQDGVSQAAELLSLADAGVLAINLTMGLTGQSIAGATDNVVYGETNYVRTDGTMGAASDVFLAFVSGAADVSAPSIEVVKQTLDDSKRPTVPDGDRRGPFADSGAQNGGAMDRQPGKSSDGPASTDDFAGRGSNQIGGEGGGASAIRPIDTGEAAPNADPEQTFSDLARRLRENSLVNPAGGGGDARHAGDYDRRAGQADPYDTSLGEAHRTGRGALSKGLGMEAKVLRMVDSMAGFGASKGAVDLLLTDSKKLDPKVRELLTSLPDAKVG